MSSEESGKDSHWVISDIWWDLWGVGVMQSFGQTVGIHVIELAKVLLWTMNLVWLKFWGYASFIEWCLITKWNFCVSVPLIYWNISVFKDELLIFPQNLNNPTENDIKVKLAFLMALSI